MSASPLIQFRGVKKAFGPKVVYSGLDLDVYPGESLTIIGGSGVGKSVMLKMLIGLLKVDAGSILFHGEDITKKTGVELGHVRQSIGMLFQGAALFDSISVGANVAYGLNEHFYKKMSDAEIADRVEWALSLRLVDVSSPCPPSCRKTTPQRSRRLPPSPSLCRAGGQSGRQSASCARRSPCSLPGSRQVCRCG